MEALSRLGRREYPIDQKTTLTRLPKPDARQKEILPALGVSLPQKQGGRQKPSGTASP